MSERMPEDMPDKVPECLLDRMPEDMPDRMPDRMSEDMPEDMPEGMPDKVTECLPDRTPEDLPDRMPDRMSEDMPEDVPDRVPEDMPEDMPDRMPEDMPDKMPEDMSDRMPEDLPVTKRIDVMVGITRSKVINFYLHLDIHNIRTRSFILNPYSNEHTAKGTTPCLDFPGMSCQPSVMPRRWSLSLSIRTSWWLATAIKKKTRDKHESKKSGGTVCHFSLLYLPSLAKTSY